MTTSNVSAFELVLFKDRLIVALGLAVISAFAWVYLVYLAWGMAAAPMGAEAVMPRTQAWSLWDFLFMFIMWSVMMVAMMAPSAAPMLLMFARLNRQWRARQEPYVPAGLFLLGYVMVWAGFSLLATLAQGWLQATALLSPAMVSASPILGGVILVAAGIFQWTPLKHICLRRCRSPLAFLMTGWREGARGALLMGLRYGSFCTGCCWLLMALLFVTGVMNVLWVAMLSLFVLLEKVIPGGHATGMLVSRISGVFLMMWGGWMLVST